MSKHNLIDIRVPIEEDNPAIILHEDKCIKCKLCTKICRDFIGVYGNFDLEKTNDTAICIHCGQCANICPVDSITEKYEYKDVENIINANDKVVIVSTAPAVRVALGELFDMEEGEFVEGKMVSLLRELGFNYVLDVNFGADMTIVEEASEFIERIKDENAVLPQFTSCCPAWVKYVETYHPDFIPNLSSAKSPIGMQGVTIKTYFAKKMNIDPSKIVTVTITPCSAKKFEVRRDEMNASAKYNNVEGMRDNDYIITTRELALWAKEKNIDFTSLEDSKFDKFMGEASGAGVIFGNTGGVMEAALRTSYNYLTNEPVPETLYQLESVRDLEEIKEATVNIKGKEVNVAVVYGTANATKLIEKIKSGEKNYHFVEVMACPGGCIGGGGQPKKKIPKRDAALKKRIEGLYQRDNQLKIRSSHENEEIKLLYKEFYEKPLSHLAEELLHTSFTNRSSDLGN
ncbi:[FeFe] hydrogenase, group A [[Clostridium] colinum]|uniref:[FeFe] hydrogenase, group A n=1 Tax=[Clostridium] colinum TaxID=36835 RepID=UPI002024AFE9|nr:[FeFe] hydrogenase, group A [[Clostridium] colinum]